VTDNEKDSQLLMTDFGRLVVKYQGTIRVIVGRYIASGMFKESETEDVVQTINESLLMKQTLIQAHYAGSTLLRTYLSAIIRHICLKEFQSKTRRPRLLPLAESNGAHSNGALDDVLILEETVRFRKVLALHHGELPKVLLCLKLHFRLPITRGEILRWWPHCGEGDIRVLLDAFGGRYDVLDDIEVFREFSKHLEKAEGRKNSATALQKWTNRRINQILGLMNGDPPVRAHNRKTLEILFENYTRPFLRI